MEGKGKVIAEGRKMITSAFSAVQQGVLVSVRSADLIWHFDKAIL